MIVVCVMFGCQTNQRFATDRPIGLEDLIGDTQTAPPESVATAVVALDVLETVQKMLSGKDAPWRTVILVPEGQINRWREGRIDGKEHPIEVRKGPFSESWISKRRPMTYFITCEIIRLSATDAVVEAGYAVAPEASASYQFTLKKDRKGWKITAKELLWVS